MTGQLFQRRIVAVMGAGALFLSSLAARAGEMETILNGDSKTDITAASSYQRGIGEFNARPGQGNYSTLQQRGAGNAANVEQTAIAGGYGNVTSVLQQGDGNQAGLSQTGASNTLGLNQQGNNNTAQLGQSGQNLGLQVNQFGGQSVTVTQYGMGAPGTAPITITQK